MKVVIPVGALHVGGGCRVLANLANALAAAGHAVDVVIPDGAPIAYPLHCGVIKVPELTSATIPYGDVVLTNFYTTFLPAFQAWPNQCVRLSLGFEPLWAPDAEFALWTYRQGVPVISISHWLDDTIHDAVGTRTRVVNLGVNRRIFHPKGHKRHHEEKVILYIARDPNAGYSLKGFDDFAQAMHVFKRYYKKRYRLYLICPERPLALPGFPCRVFQPQTDRELAHLYRRADVFVSSSWFEGFALPPLEAMACGTPVVTTDSGGVRDFCHHKQSAYIAPPRNPKRLAHGIYKVLRKRDFRRHITHGAIASAREFDEAAQYRRMVAAIERIHAQR